MRSALKAAGLISDHKKPFQNCHLSSGMEGNKREPKRDVPDVTKWLSSFINGTFEGWRKTCKKRKLLWRDRKKTIDPRLLALSGLVLGENSQKRLQSDARPNDAKQPKKK